MESFLFTCINVSVYLDVQQLITWYMCQSNIVYVSLIHLSTSVHCSSLSKSKLWDLLGMLDGPVGYSRVQIIIIIIFLKYQGVGLEAKYKILWSPRASAQLWQVWQESVCWFIKLFYWLTDHFNEWTLLLKQIRENFTLETTLKTSV